jgi:hypothetical protein
MGGKTALGLDQVVVQDTKDAIVSILGAVILLALGPLPNQDGSGSETKSLLLGMTLMRAGGGGGDGVMMLVRVEKAWMELWKRKASAGPSDRPRRQICCWRERRIVVRCIAGGLLLAS